MKILSVYVKAFGKLNEFCCDFSKGLNVLKEDNSFGKTTLTQFLKAVLYGLDYRQKDFFEPWNFNRSFKYGGHLIFEKDGKQFKLERYFGSTLKQEEVKLTDLLSGKELDASDIGRKLLGLSSESFVQSAFVPQEKIAAASTADFEQKLSGMMDANDGGRGFNDAIDDLRTYSKQFKHERGNGGKIFELTNTVGELKSEIAKCKENIVRAETLAADVSVMEIESISLQKKIEILEDEREALSVEFSERSENGTMLQAELDTLRQRLKAYDSKMLEDDTARVQNLSNDLKAAKNKNRSLKLSLLILSVLAAIAAVVCFGSSEFLIGSILLGVTVILFSAWIFAHFSSQKTTKSNLNELNLLLNKYIFADGDFLQGAKKLWELNQGYRADLLREKALSESLRNSNAEKSEAVKSRLNELSEKLEAHRRGIQQIQFEKGQKQRESELLRSSNNIAELGDRLLNAENGLSEAEYKYKTAQLTLEILRQAKENLSTAYLPRLSQMTGDLLLNFSGGKFTNVLIDKEFNIKITENQLTQPLKYFSRGIREIAAFCFRVALSKLVFGKIPFLILDDPFVNLDEKNFKEAMNLLDVLSKKDETQIVYFTCRGK